MKESKKMATKKDLKTMKKKIMDEDRKMDAKMYEKKDSKRKK